MKGREINDFEILPCATNIPLQGLNSCQGLDSPPPPSLNCCQYFMPLEAFTVKLFWGQGLFLFVNLQNHISSIIWILISYIEHPEFGCRNSAFSVDQPVFFPVFFIFL